MSDKNTKKHDPIMDHEWQYDVGEHEVRVECVRCGRKLSFRAGSTPRMIRTHLERYEPHTECRCRPRPRSFPTLSAPPPTEPGYYWARRGTDRHQIVSVKPFQQYPGGLGVYVIGIIMPYRLQEFDAWSERLPEPEAKAFM